ncbi:alpha/beta hydrolase fold protein [Kribbella flavida DSM 17836]|uniref:Alpha/beta hydrolase fold protein n=1 Tax=Kribbella flavida (strain DSM 17836 / JCM 10339 / NBRC 14399) TaxID=479435 RepID=D2PSJ7_KRIFD|nr:alpha/beta hydrolase [Kribbella flavida]ADB33135.1 alpha/beta hydrolase fold protein [Kribbella flavida DSM 17836]
MQTVITEDGRTLAVEEWGVPDGRPVLYAHGSPMSRLARYPDDRLFTELGVRLITYDRPGFGHSTPHPGRRVVDGADDIAAIADALDLGRFPVFGVSGGGPHALAFAARHPARITRVATLASPAPCDAEGLDWTAGMMDGNRGSAAAARQGRAQLAEYLATVESEDLAKLLPPAERAVLTRPEVQAMLSAAFAEALRPGMDGWIDDELALFGTPWGFDPAAITVPATLWHGDLDTVIPVSHAIWLAGRIRSATLVQAPEAGHVGHFEATPAILRWLLEGDQDPGRG